MPRVPLFLPLDVLFLDATHGALTAETALTTFNPVSRLACETYTKSRSGLGYPLYPNTQLSPNKATARLYFGEWPSSGRVQAVPSRSRQGTVESWAPRPFAPRHESDPVTHVFTNAMPHLATPSQTVPHPAPTHVKTPRQTPPHQKLPHPAGPHVVAHRHTSPHLIRHTSPEEHHFAPSFVQPCPVT